MSFRMKETDRAFFVLTIDDANRFLGRIYDICHEYGVPLCPAIIPWNLDNVYDDPESCECPEKFREIIRHIVSLTTDKAVITTWADVFDRFWGVSK